MQQISVVPAVPPVVPAVPGGHPWSAGPPWSPVVPRGPPRSPVVPRGPPWSPVVPHGPPLSPVVPRCPPRSRFASLRRWARSCMRRAAVRKATCCSPCRCMGICETPHDLRPEHAALPALLVAARAGDGCAGGGGGGVHGLFLNKQKKKRRKKIHAVMPLLKVKLSGSTNWSTLSIEHWSGISVLYSRRSNQKKRQKSVTPRGMGPHPRAWLPEVGSQREAPGTPLDAAKVDTSISVVPARFPVVPAVPRGPPWSPVVPRGPQWSPVVPRALVPLV